MYIQSLTGETRKYRISNAGGWQPRWRADGKELYYVGGANETMMAVAVAPSASGLDVGLPRALFTTKMFVDLTTYRTQYAVSGDGRRFLLTRLISSPSATHISVVLNWRAMD